MGDAYGEYGVEDFLYFLGYFLGLPAERKLR